jgi:hypothetical protein
MSLKNLVGVSLAEVPASRETIVRLLSAATGHIADAQATNITAETRFGAAYTAIRMLADVALNANGYRTLTSRPGHHQTAIQTLPLTIGFDGTNGAGARCPAQTAPRDRIFRRSGSRKRGARMCDPSASTADRGAHVAEDESTQTALTDRAPG